MTKATWNSLLAGGGLLATWLAVTPNTTTPARSSLAAAPRTSVVRDVTADDLNLQESRLREHLGSAPLRPSGRNPFRFGGASEKPRQTPAAPAAMAPPAPLPSLSLSGIATDKGTRSAIITGDGQLYLVKEGELVAGRYHVVTVDGDAVTLRSDSGEDLRLVLR